MFSRQYFDWRSKIGIIMIDKYLKKIKIDIIGIFMMQHIVFELIDIVFFCCSLLRNLLHRDLKYLHYHSFDMI